MARPRDGHLVVVTHHAPHSLCLPRAHLSGWAAGNAASDLSQLTDSEQPKLWVRGHVHGTIDLTRPAAIWLSCGRCGGQTFRGPGEVRPRSQERGSTLCPPTPPNSHAVSLCAGMAFVARTRGPECPSHQCEGRTTLRRIRSSCPRGFSAVTLTRMPSFWQQPVYA